MKKTHRCVLHLRCIAFKLAHGRNAMWHWHHLLREFGAGPYARF